MQIIWKFNIFGRFVSVNVLRATSEIFFETITKLFDENKLPWQNLKTVTQG